MNKLTLLGYTSCFIFSAQAIANEHAHHHHNHTDLAPIGVMGTHTHEPDEWMLSYRYGTMRMKGNRDRNDSMSIADVHSNFMVAPTKMTMEMHMFGLMGGVTEDLTFMAMLPYKRLSMDHITRMGMNFTTKSSGVGDARLSGIYTLYKEGNSQVLLNAGISLPTGSIDKRDDTPAMANAKLPYPMQLGSGTYDLLPGITYTNSYNSWSWGTQANATLRIGKNSNDYRLGHEYQLTGWAARKLNDVANVSIRLDGKTWGDVSGADPELNPMMVPTARTDLRGGKRIDLLVGLTLAESKGKLAGHNLALEAGMPIYQHLDGPQLETDYRLMLGYQWRF